MREYFETQKKLLLEQVSDQYPETERTLNVAFGKALDSAFEDLEKNSVQPDSEERFWKGLSQLLSDCGCLRHGYQYFENVAETYLALENQFRCWTPQEDVEWAKNADYVQVQRWDERNRHKYFTLILPAEPPMYTASAPNITAVLSTSRLPAGIKSSGFLLPAIILPSFPCPFPYASFFMLTVTPSPTGSTTIPPGCWPVLLRIPVHPVTMRLISQTRLCLPRSS